MKIKTVQILVLTGEWNWRIIIKNFLTNKKVRVKRVSSATFLFLQIGLLRYTGTIITLARVFVIYWQLDRVMQKICAKN